MSDLVKRQEVMDAVKDWINSGEIGHTNATYYLRKRINAIPSAEPNTGEWIEYTKVIVPEPYNEWEQAWKCSECGFDDGFWTWKFCPNCGADMREKSCQK